MRNRKKQAAGLNKASKFDNTSSTVGQQICYEGESLAQLLKLIKSEIDSARNLDNTLPEKVWIKQQFSVGVNEVTRALERMRPTAAAKYSTDKQHTESIQKDEKSSEQLQAILLATDCNPRWLTKHLPNLAHSKGVPLIFVKDKKGASLRLGELLKLRTAIAIGVKVRGNVINQFMEKVIIGKEVKVDTPESTDLT